MPYLWQKQQQARAKINLGLLVGPRAADGYHPLSTLFQSLELADTLELCLEPLRADAAERPEQSLELQLAPELAGTSAATTVPALPDNNLLNRIAADYLLKTSADLQQHYHWNLYKAIPSGAGLGGGSADAAAAVKLLEAAGQAGQLGPNWQPLDSFATLALCKRYGADIPFQYLGGTALGRGIGELLSPLRDLPPLPVVLVMPPLHVPTAAAFAKLDALPRPELPPADLAFEEATAICESLDMAARLGSAELLGFTLERLQSYLDNDFLPALLAADPSLEKLLQLLEEAAEAYGLSGSGSCFYALCSTAEKARALAARLARDFPHYYLQTTHFTAND